MPTSFSWNLITSYNYNMYSDTCVLFGKKIIKREDFFW